MPARIWGDSGGTAGAARAALAKTTLVHAIHVTDAEMDALAEADTVICSCPTTERNLGDGIIDAAKAAAGGIRFAFGLIVRRRSSPAGRCAPA